MGALLFFQNILHFQKLFVPLQGKCIDMKTKLLKRFRKRLRIVKINKSISWAAQEKKSKNSIYAWHSIKIGTFKECLLAIHSKINERERTYLDSRCTKNYEKIIKF